VTDRSTAGCWVKRMMASKTREAELHCLPRYPNTTINPEVLQYACAISLEG